MSVAALLNYTYDDYTQWEGEWELIDGTPISMAPAPMRIHQNIATEILFALKSTLDEEGCPECILSYENDWKVTEETVLRPDIVLVCDDEHEAYLTKAPKIIVEVLSPSTVKKDETVKFDIYEAEGVQYYILVYPNDLKAKVYSLNKEGKYIKVSDFTHEVLSFDDLECEISLDFAHVFKKFRK
ncbi:MAG: Uma2 family endonuclease [Sulfurovum sp.]|nr:MAG: Uma2 family endonuclease [Sulfurovum sp.]RUM70812.1 MAG: Uma2 family endonuclease [Sulfurovum sp.]